MVLTQCNGGAGSFAREGAVGSLNKSDAILGNNCTRAVPGREGLADLLRRWYSCEDDLGECSGEGPFQFVVECVGIRCHGGTIIREAYKTVADVLW